MKILFTGGGSGGHLMPIVAIARELKRLEPKENFDFYYIGPKEEAAAFELKSENFKVKKIMAGKLRRYFSISNIIDILFKIPAGFVQSFLFMGTINPKMVFSKGGTGAVPVALAAAFLGIPVFLHESDAVPGLSSRVIFNWAKKTFISFPKTEYFNLKKTILVGNPVRKELTEGSREEARKIFGIKSQKKIIMFWGGSQGAKALNDFVLLTLDELLPLYELIHAAGPKNYREIKIQSEALLNDNLKSSYHLRGSLGEIELKHALKAADLVISRAGSGSIFELAVCGKPSLLVPLPSAASGHQLKNGYQYAHSGAAIVIEQENLIPHFFAGKIEQLINQPGKLQEMQEAALKFAKPLAAKAIAREMLEYLKK